MNVKTMTLSPWLESLTYNWDQLEHVSTVRNFDKHDMIFHEGDQVHSVFIVKEGRIRLFLNSLDGREKAIAIIGRNGLLGESSMNEPRTYICNAITASEATLLQCPADQFEKIIWDNKAYMKQVMELMSMKIRLLSTHAVQLSYGQPFARLCEVLYHLGSSYGVAVGQETKITISFTHQEIADLIGATRVTVANHINELRKNNIIEKRERHYYIKDMDQLVAYTN